MRGIAMAILTVGLIFVRQRASFPAKDWEGFSVIALIALTLIVIVGGW